MGVCSREKQKRRSSSSGLLSFFLPSFSFFPPFLADSLYHFLSRHFYCAFDKVNLSSLPLLTPLLPPSLPLFFASLQNYLTSLASSLTSELIFVSF